MFTGKGGKRHFPSSLTYCKMEMQMLTNYYKLTDNQRIEIKGDLQSNIHHKKD